MKIFGSIITVLSFVLTCEYMMFDKRKRLSVLKSLCKLPSDIIREFRSGTEREEALSKALANFPSHCKSYDDVKQFLTKEELAIFSDFCLQLGNSSLPDEEKKCKYFTDYITTVHSDCTQDIKKNYKLWQSLSFLTGLLTVIILY